jgi:hypothetical protein
VKKTIFLVLQQRKTFNWITFVQGETDNINQKITKCKTSSNIENLLRAILDLVNLSQL